MRSVFTSAVMTVLLAGVASFSVEGADAAADTKEVKRDDALSDRVQADLRLDPLFEGMRINVDLYRGLAIVHGTAPSSEAVSILNEKIKRLKGVDAVFNYMSTPDESTIGQPVDV